MYTVEVKLAFQRVGQPLTTVGVVYNDSRIRKINHVVYNTHGVYLDRIAIDHQGNVTLKKKFT